MGTPFISEKDITSHGESSNRFELVDGSHVGVIGSGPAGSLFSYYLLEMAERMGKELIVDIYESRDFSRPAPAGCNMCGGIISESLVQNLASDGINLPTTVVQRGIDSYILHMDVGSVRIDTPMQEKRIAAVSRGSGPRDIQEMKWESFDGYLQNLALEKGARLIPERISGVDINDDGRPQIKPRKSPARLYDLLCVAVGVNSPSAKLFEKLNFGYQSPQAAKTFICEYYFGDEVIKEVLGNSMHVFLLDIPRLEFAAIIPKGDYATVCMLGDGIDDDLVKSFLNSEAVQACMPPGWQADSRSCWCLPRININGAKQPYFDRIVFIGDCGVTRLYKDGIGAAYRTAKAAATTAILQGVSASDFEQYFLPTCKAINLDNTIGKLNFIVTGQIKGLRFARGGLLRMTIDEQEKEGNQRYMSTVMWDMFTGSAPYQEILMRTMHPVFIVNFFRSMIAAIWHQLTKAG